MSVFGGFFVCFVFPKEKITSFSEDIELKQLNDFFFFLNYKFFSFLQAWLLSVLIQVAQG